MKDDINRKPVRIIRTAVIS